MPRGGRATPIDSNLVARLGGAVKGAVRGARDAWFGPGQPLQPLAPPSVRGRLFDFPVAWNLSVLPRGESGESAIDFASLRALADPTLGGLDLLRLAIETRKDQMESQRWSIRGRDESDGGKQARDIEQALRFPDGVHTFAQWQRMLVEDLLVIDAPTVYLAPTLAGPLVPQVMDGALLKPLLQEDGRTPMPPEAAYMQVLKGVPAVPYTTDEIVRLPRNLRSHRVYGMSPVEQVQMTVSIGLRRALSQLEFYTAGSVPDAVAETPPGWSTTQVSEFQTYFDAIAAGNTAMRRGLIFLPGGVKVQPLKPGDALKDEFDEWLARIICYCFSLSPQALTKQMNRATAQTAQQSAREEGLEPLKNWFKDLVDCVLMKAFDAADLEFAYKDEEITDPQVKANVVTMLAGKKPVITQDEAREAFGYDPMTPEQKDELQPAPPPMLGAVPGQDEQGATDADAQAEADKKVAADERKRAAEMAELRARSDNAAALGLAVATGLQELAKSLKPGGKKTVHFGSDGNGVLTSATLSNGKDQ